MPTRGSEAMRAETRNQRLFVGLMYCLILCGHVRSTGLQILCNAIGQKHEFSYGFRIISATHNRI